jgi:hypothetical protein
MRVVLAKLPALILLTMLIGVPALLGSLLIVPGLFMAAIGVMVVPEMMLRELTLGRAIREGIRVGWKHMTTVGFVLAVVALAGLVTGLIVAPMIALLPPLFSLAAWALLGGLAASVIGATVSAVCIEHHRSSPAPAPPPSPGA